jgi:hypothetical protein
MERQRKTVGVKNCNLRAINDMEKETLNMPIKTMKKMNERKGLMAMGFMPLFVGVILWIGVLTPARTQVITIGGSDEEHARSIIQTTDGGYAVAGDTESFGAGSTDVYVVKLDGSGNIQWTRTIGGEYFDGGESIIQTTDGGYAIAGETNSFGAGNQDVYVVKLDGSGNIQWTRTIGGEKDDKGYSIIQTTDGGYAVAGYTKSFGAGDLDVYVVKLDGCGNIQWTRWIGGGCAGPSIIQAADRGYAVAGWICSFGAGGADVYIVKLDGSGNIQWTRTIGGRSDDYGHSVIQTRDGGYAIAGETESFGAGGRDVYVVKLDGSGGVNVGRCGSVASNLGTEGTGGSVSVVNSRTASGGTVSSGGVARSGGSVSVCVPLSGRK